MIGYITCLSLDDMLRKFCKLISFRVGRESYESPPPRARAFSHPGISNLNFDSILFLLILYKIEILNYLLFIIY